MRRPCGGAIRAGVLAGVLLGSGWLAAEESPAVSRAAPSPCAEGLAATLVVMEERSPMKDQVATALMWRRMDAWAALEKGEEEICQEHLAVVRSLLGLPEEDEAARRGSSPDPGEEKATVPADLSSSASAVSVPGMARPTIREVAQRAGVSLGTVSNVINGQARVRPETQALVERTIRELGYRPDAIAQSLIARRSQAGNGEGDADRPRLSAVGYLSVDYVAWLEELPEREERVTARTIERILGGPAANVALSAARLAGPALDVELITNLGFDEDSDWALVELDRRGVSTIGIERSADRRLSRAFVLVDRAGRRTIVNEPVMLGETDLLRYLGRIENRATAETPHCLHVEGFQISSLEGALPAVRKSGVFTSLHTVGLPGEWRTREGVERLGQLFDVLFVNLETARAVLGSEAEEGPLFQELCSLAGPRAGRGALVLTLGRDGAWLRAGDDSTWRIRPKRVRVVDRTGAGDVFAGAFLARWLGGGEFPLVLREATAAAAASVTRAGADFPAPDSTSWRALCEATPKPAPVLSPDAPSPA